MVLNFILVNQGTTKKWKTAKQRLKNKAIKNKKSHRGTNEATRQ